MESCTFIAVKCDEIQNPNGSESNMSTNGIQSYKIFSCGSGSSMKGSSTLTCNEDGSWTQNVPECGMHLSFYEAKSQDRHNSTLIII